MAFRILENKGREDWLQQRKPYVTATEAASIASGSDAAFSRLWESKRSDSSFGGTAAMKWGNEREPIIADEVRKTYTHLEHNERLIVREGTKWAATPDMLSPEPHELMTCQIKTVRADKAWETIDDLPLNYRRQAEWEMMVAGADSCVFAWESYTVDEDGEFIPGELRIGVLHSDSKMREKLIKASEAFVEYTPADIEQVNDFEVDALISDLLVIHNKKNHLRSDLKHLGEKESGVHSKLIELLGESPRRVMGAEGLIEVRSGRESERFDRAAFAKQYPDLESKFIVRKPAPAGISFKAVS